MLVMALTAGVFMTALRSASPIRAFRRSFIWTFALVLLTPWLWLMLGYPLDAHTH